MFFRAVILCGVLLSSGCLLLPDASHQPVVHNPFPQLSRVAVAPFFNQSDEPTVDGREFALAYFSELQAVQGFEVVPLSVVEEVMLDQRIVLSDPREVRRLAKALGVDAIVIGAVTDFDPYYPPRCGLHIEWYSANEGFHEVPAGYGLPWGTPDEEYIPAPLVFEAEFALAKAQLATQSPQCDVDQGPLPPPPANTEPEDLRPVVDPFADVALMSAQVGENGELLPAPDARDSAAGPAPRKGAPSELAMPLLPAGWPDERGFIPPGPSPVPPACNPQEGPVMRHTRIFQGNDPELTEALASYFHFRDDARFGGWQAYLQRSNDFIRFCCHLHIYEMLSARGGGGETRVVWRWSDDR